MAGTLTTQPTQRRRSLAPWFGRGPLSAFREMEDLMERFWGEEGDGWGTQLLAPPLDVSETDKAISLRIDLPGVSPKEIDIQVSGNQLTVSGERKEQKEEKEETYHRIERRCGRFSRSIMLPCEVQDDKVDASYQDGVLNITLPKTAEATAKHIEVKT
ncbi:Spore protein SP21 [Bremerella volcania]|uniref:Spore protein SP21 n=1 Tax=Bremerella volcania TaxID=2527984 RepID=A0A518C5Y9_9BACT|nr:Hsp20/alpha crystallin family protein [Bremerella volcania]QDU74627.1 Spore protein SP21 [Bremerella volcania]